MYVCACIGFINTYTNFSKTKPDNSYICNAMSSQLISLLLSLTTLLHCHLMMSMFLPLREGRPPSTQERATRRMEQPTPLVVLAVKGTTR